MKKISYNLAATPKINGWAFTLRAAILVAAILLLGAVAMTNLGRQLARDRAEKSESGMIGRQASERRNLNLQQSREIAAWKKSWGRALAAANTLIDRKVFSFGGRLDFLEGISNPGIRIRHLSLANESAGRVRMAISARSLKELFELYKKLAPYELVIANETQVNDEYQASLNFGIPDEKI